MNSWKITENSCGSQTAYGLLLKFVGIAPILPVDEFTSNTFSYSPNPFNNEMQIKVKAPFNYEFII